MRVIHFPISLSVAIEEIKARLSLKECARAAGLCAVILLAALLIVALVAAILVFGVWAAHAQVQLQEQAGVIGQAYDHQGHEFPRGVEGQCWIEHWNENSAYLGAKVGTMYCFHNGRWSWHKPVAKAKKTIMYDCPYGQHYHPLAKDIAPADWARWQKKDVKYADAGLPVLDGSCRTDDFDERIGPPHNEKIRR